MHSAIFMKKMVKKKNLIMNLTRILIQSGNQAEPGNPGQVDKVRFYRHPLLTPRKKRGLITTQKLGLIPTHPLNTVMGTTKNDI